MENRLGLPGIKEMVEVGRSLGGCKRVLERILVMEMFCLLTVSVLIFYLGNCSVVQTEIIMGKLGKRLINLFVLFLRATCQCSVISK